MTSPSLQDAVGRLTELLESATPGPWKAEHFGNHGMDVCSDNASMPIAMACDADDAALIVEAINALPSLLSALVEMRWKNEALGRALGPFANAYRDNMLHVVVEYHYDLSGPTSRILTPSEFKAARQALRQKESAK